VVPVSSTLASAYQAHGFGARILAMTIRSWRLSRPCPDRALRSRALRPRGNAALRAAGAELKFANGLSLRGKLEGEFAGSVTSYAASATLRKTW